VLHLEINRITTIRSPPFSAEGKNVWIIPTLPNVFTVWCLISNEYAFMMYLPKHRHNYTLLYPVYTTQYQTLYPKSQRYGSTEIHFIF